MYVFHHGILLGMESVLMSLDFPQHKESLVQGSYMYIIMVLRYNNYYDMKQILHHFLLQN